MTDFKQPEPLGTIFPEKSEASAKWHRITVTGLLGICAAMLAVLTWGFFQPPVIAYQNLPFEIAGNTKIFYPGQTVPVKVTRCNSLNHDLIYTVTRSLKNIETRETITMPSTKVSMEPGCHISISSIHILPIDLKPGTYQATGIKPGTYQATGIGTVQGSFGELDVPFYSQPFIVKERE